MVLIDNGPLLALFGPQDFQHRRCREVLASIREPLITTVPVLTEAFRMLTPGSQGSDRLRDFIMQGGLIVLYYPSTPPRSEYSGRKQGKI